jgi:hypothetical protein
VELRFSRHSPDCRVTQNFYSPNQRKTRQNHVFAEHLYSALCTSPWKIDHHDCVCVIIINKSPCQVCVCILESGRNKAQLAGKTKRLTERRKKTLAKLASKFKKLLANSKSHSHLASWRVVISTPGCIIHGQCFDLWALIPVPYDSEGEYLLLVGINNWCFRTRFLVLTWTLFAGKD